MPEDLLVKVYVENVIVNETYGLQSDSVKIHKEAIFRKYKITEKIFEDEMAKFSADKESWTRFFKKANDFTYLDCMLIGGYKQQATLE